MFRSTHFEDFKSGIKEVWRESVCVERDAKMNFLDCLTTEELRRVWLGLVVDREVD